MKMFRWMRGSILEDQIKMKNIQDKLKVTLIEDKMRKIRQRWFDTKEARRGNSEYNCLELVETLRQRGDLKRLG